MHTTAIPPHCWQSMCRYFACQYRIRSQLQHRSSKQYWISTPQPIECAYTKYPEWKWRDCQHRFGNCTEGVAKLDKSFSFSYYIRKMTKISFTQSGGRFRDTFQKAYEHDRKTDARKIHRHDRIEHFTGNVGKKTHDREQQNSAGNNFLHILSNDKTFKYTHQLSIEQHR